MEVIWAAVPRQARLDAPGFLHHIMVRGIGDRKIGFTINLKLSFDRVVECGKWEKHGR